VLLDDRNQLLLQPRTVLVVFRETTGQQNDVSDPLRRALAQRLG
jgi:hypothetical protein